MAKNRNAKKKPAVSVTVAVGAPKKKPADRYMDLLSGAMGKNAGPASKKKGGY